jgi:NAD(P)-dependent dehydrogenase (short-subunit alcohol dehydrogenase family)
VASQLAIVTGANRGIGLEVSRELAQRGMRVWLTSRDAERGEQAAARLAGQGLDVQARRLDIADPGSVAAFGRALADADETVQALVNNAGVSLDGFDAGVAERTLATNTFGAAAVTDAVAPRLAPGGRVVMVSSGMGDLSSFGEPLRARFLEPALDRAGLEALLREFVEAVRRGEHRRGGWPGNAYSVSKAGLNALVRVMAPALRARGVLINAVCPGWVRTDMGGPGAPRSLQQGASGVVWAATLPPDGPTGAIFRDGRRIDW